LLLRWQGNLISPLQNTALLINVASGGQSFSMVGDDRALAAPADADEAVSADASVSGLPSATTASVSQGTMTLETLTAELAAAGVDVDAVSAKLTAEGRSLDNILAVVNSGRTTVADLAARLQTTTADTSGTSAATAAETGPSEPASAGLLDIQWGELGSVAYDLWFMLAVTVVVIVVARPIGWLVNRVKRLQGTVRAKTA
ncbi:MAG: hypothetical protein IT323_14075, partial [Anaerolineae bacterium]|nr:hypothetical protein [Anaerolineae bacterium]